MSSARQVLKRTWQSLVVRRNCSNQDHQPSISLERDVKNARIRLLSLNRPPVNSLNKKMLKELVAAIDQVEEQRDSLDGIIIASNNKNIFSAGLDFPELLATEKEQLSDFLSSLLEFWIRLYGCQVTVASAVSGHAPAGGTLIALCTDYRVMVNNPHLKIGLNEVQFGMFPAFWLLGSFISTLGQRAAERASQMGTLFSPEEALNVGLVDSLAADKSEALEKCREEIMNFSKANSSARSKVKMMIRQPLIDKLRNNFDTEIKLYVDILTSESIRSSISTYANSLTRMKQSR